MVYRFKALARCADGLDAQVVGDYLEQLRQQHGHLPPEVVVAAAQAPASPIHRAFEWDDTKAADAYRLAQAAQLIRAVVIEMDATHAPVVVRAFVSVTGDDTARTYQGIQEVLRHDAMRDELLRAAGRELGAWRRKYEVLAELSAVFEAIDAQWPSADATAASVTGRQGK